MVFSRKAFVQRGHRKKDKNEIMDNLLNFALIICPEDGDVGRKLGVKITIKKVENTKYSQECLNASSCFCEITDLPVEALESLTTISGTRRNAPPLMKTKSSNIKIR